MFFFVYNEPVNRALSRWDQPQASERPPSRNWAAAAAPPTENENLAEEA